MRHYLSFVIATKDRLNQIRRLLKSIRAQPQLPDQIIIVDAGHSPLEDLIKEFPGLSIKYLRHGVPSPTRQRNIGIEAIDQKATLVGFIDDDAVLEDGSLGAMMEFWRNAADDVAGAAFNMVNHPRPALSFLKSAPLTEVLGLYGRKKGVVARSGFQTMIGYVTGDTYTLWLPTGAVVWRRNIFDEFRFDEWFDYNYLEDVDFSYRVGKKYKLAVVAKAEYSHYPEHEKRKNGYAFGRKEVSNRIYFVEKNHEFSLFRCYMVLIIRMFITLGLILRRDRLYHFQRFCGNTVEILTHNLRKKQ